MWLYHRGVVWNLKRRIGHLEAAAAQPVAVGGHADDRTNFHSKPAKAPEPEPLRPTRSKRQTRAGRAAVTNPICLALDLPQLDAATALLKKVKAHIGMVKLGLEFFCAHGHPGCARGRAPWPAGGSSI